MPHRTLYTIGHSTRTWDELVTILKQWKIDELVDVRTVPRSRAFPWFSKEQMEIAMPQAGIGYVHIASLGGLRRPSKESVNKGWRNARFQAYADHMQTPEFAAGLKELNQRLQKRRVCIMCSEAVWWRCHRRMIADAEVARGIPVKHLMSPTAATQHELSDFAVVKKRRGHPALLTYPATRKKGQQQMTAPEYNARNASAPAVPSRQ